MPKYLLQASYTAEGLRGLLKEGATKRKAAAEQLIDSLGGKLEVFYPAFGDTDVFLIVDAPDNESAAAASMAVGASGAVQVKTTVLLTPEEMDRATRKTVSYRPPGK